MSAADDDFEELRELKAELAARHRRLIRTLLAVGIALLALAGVAYALLDIEARPSLLLFPVGLASVALAIIARSLYSALSDVDTRARDDEIVGVPEPKDDEERS